MTMPSGKGDSSFKRECQMARQEQSPQLHRLILILTSPILTFFLLLFAVQAAPSSSFQKLANQLVTYESTGREIPAFFSEANEPLVLFSCGLIILLIATGLKSGLARKPSWSQSAERPEGRSPLSAR